MFSLLLNVLKKSKGIYHKFSYAYNYTLYRDCLNPKLKNQYYRKVIYFEMKLDD